MSQKEKITLTLPSEVNSDIPEDVEKVVLKALESDPSDRYQSARDFQKDLEAVGRPPAFERGDVVFRRHRMPCG